MLIRCKYRARHHESDHSAVNEEEICGACKEQSCQFHLCEQLRLLSFQKRVAVRDHCLEGLLVLGQSHVSIREPWGIPHYEIESPQDSRLVHVLDQEGIDRVSVVSNQA